MSDSQSPDTVSNPAVGVTGTRTVRFWGAPIVITLVVMSAVAALYLVGFLNPANNLRGFPVAVVNEDAGPTGKQIVTGLVTGLNADKFDVRVLSHAEALHQMDNARLYGQVVIPKDFSAKLQSFLQGATQRGAVERPDITVTTNPRASSLGASIAGQTLVRAAGTVNAKAGKKLSAEVTQLTGGAPLSGAMAVLLANPVSIQTTVYNPLPEGTGSGLSAYFYSLLLVLAGVLGSIIVSSLVDSMLGYVPAGLGAVYEFTPQTNTSRFRALILKWASMAALSLPTSAVYVAMSGELGMPISHSWALWLFGVFVIAAVGIGSISLIAVLGSLGILVSLLLFVVIGLPSVGATIPVEAAPSFVGWLASADPMQQVFLGVRSLVYFDGRADAGLTHGLTMTAIILFVGLILGAIVTRRYDQRGYHRIAATLDTAVDAPA